MKPSVDIKTTVVSLFFTLMIPFLFAQPSYGTAILFGLLNLLFMGVTFIVPDSQVLLGHISRSFHRDLIAVYSALCLVLFLIMHNGMVDLEIPPLFWNIFAAAIIEEHLFRRTLPSVLANRKGLGVPSALILSNIAFIVAHEPSALQSVLTIIMMSAACTYLSSRYGLIYSIMVHLGYNTIIFTVAF